ncbi:hypothetical protein U4E84_12035 [Halorubrum sp. AD140]|uniref:hypothetical protein n=1 Tax=Halorubrum sp. AD140 TaxID=3050073 RepID=UPI002ACCF94D|nr:hypothetical protein [Halorubrum sp. AD140]MDZ5812071.1 hypothetical protein [Halorubrum sp. AD140]
MISTQPELSSRPRRTRLTAPKSLVLGIGEIIKLLSHVVRVAVVDDCVAEHQLRVPITMVLIE